MAEYHVGCGIANLNIFAGRLNKKGNMWLDKSDVTDEACRSVAKFLLNRDESFIFEQNGKQYRLWVQEMKGVQE